MSRPPLDPYTLEPMEGDTPENPRPCGPTHYEGCACHEARWIAKVAKLEARLAGLEATP